MSCRSRTVLPARSSLFLVSEEPNLCDEVSAAFKTSLDEISKGLDATMPGPYGEIPDHEVRLEAVGKFCELLKVIQPVPPT